MIGWIALTDCDASIGLSCDVEGVEYEVLKGLTQNEGTEYEAVERGDQPILTPSRILTRTKPKNT